MKHLMILAIGLYRLCVTAGVMLTAQYVSDAQGLGRSFYPLYIVGCFAVIIATIAEIVSPSPSQEEKK